MRRMLTTAFAVLGCFVFGAALQDAWRASGAERKDDKASKELKPPAVATKPTDAITPFTDTTFGTPATKSEAQVNGPEKLGGFAPKSDAPPVAPPVPVIAPELEIRYLRVMIEKQAVEREREKVNDSARQVIDEIAEVCGKDYTPQDQIAPDGKSSGRLVCVAKEQKKP